MTADSILVCDRSRPVFEQIAGRLKRHGLELPIDWQHELPAALESRSAEVPSVLIADLRLAEENLARPSWPGQRRGLILMTDPDGESEAEKHLGAGVSDYVVKPEFRRLETVVRRVLDSRRDAHLEERIAREVIKQRELHQSLQEGIPYLIFRKPYLIFRKDREGRFTYVNEGFASLVGRAKDEVLGLTDADLFPPELAKKYREDDERVMSERQVVQTVELNRGADGEIRHVEVIKVPLYDWLERPAGVQGMFHDVTEQVRAQRRMEQEASIVAELPDAVVTCHVNGRVEFWNRAAKELYGYSEEEAKGELVASVMGLDKAACDEIWDGLFRDGNWSGRVRQSRRDGEILLVDSRCSLQRDELGEPETITWVNTDVTDRARSETPSSPMEWSPQHPLASGGAARHLQTIMESVRSAVERLRRQHPEPAFEESLGFVAQGIDYGAGLIGQLGERPQLAADGMVETRDLLTGFASFVPRFVPVNVSLQTDFEDDLRPVLGEETELRQVLLNLVLNAGKAMPEGGLLRLSAANVSLDQAALRDDEEGRPGEYVVLRVTDSGNGNAEEVRRLVFQPFFSQRPGRPGAGLGLVSVLQVAHGRGGFVRLDSQPGEGNTVEIFLPAAVASKAKNGERSNHGG